MADLVDMPQTQHRTPSHQLIVQTLFQALPPDERRLHLAGMSQRHDIRRFMSLPKKKASGAESVSLSLPRDYRSRSSPNTVDIQEREDRDELDCPWDLATALKAKDWNPRIPLHSPRCMTSFWGAKVALKQHRMVSRNSLRLIL